MNLEELANRQFEVGVLESRPTGHDEKSVQQAYLEGSRIKAKYTVKIILKLVDESSLLFYYDELFKDLNDMCREYINVTKIPKSQDEIDSIIQDVLRDINDSKDMSIREILNYGDSKDRNPENFTRFNKQQLMTNFSLTKALNKCIIQHKRLPRSVFLVKYQQYIGQSTSHHALLIGRYMHHLMIDIFSLGKSFYDCRIFKDSPTIIKIIKVGETISTDEEVKTFLLSVKTGSATLSLNNCQDFAKKISPLLINGGHYPRSTNQVSIVTTVMLFLIAISIYYLKNKVSINIH